MTNAPFSISEACKQALDKNWQLEVFQSIGSTNTYARENLEKLQTPTLVLAEHQTQGRGRGDHGWEDVGHGQQFSGSFVLSFENHTSKANIDPRWTIALGYFVYESLAKAWPENEIKFSIKAPNDIYLGEKKVAGILVEASQLAKKTFLILGLGLNVFAHPKSVDDSATNLISQIPNLAQLDFVNFLRNIAFCLETFETFVQDKYWLRNISPNLRSALNSNPFHRNNQITGIEDNGSLNLVQGYLNWLEL